MQDNTDKPMIANAGELPPELLAEIAQAEAIIFVSFDGSELMVRGTFKGDEYKPETVAAHAYLAAAYAEHDYLVDIITGKITDADRYRALRDFAALAGTDPERFEKVNGFLFAFETANGLADDATKRTEADFTKIADFLVQALIDTAPAGPVVLTGTETPQ